MPSDLVSNEPIRIAMWSGPRNISTAMMRSFGARSDCAVIDEPFYAAYLFDSGQDHPMRGRVIASQPTDWRNVVRRITGKVPDQKPIWYQKHMTHHMLPHYGRFWMGEMRNCFLIRDPARMIASYAVKWDQDLTVEMMGLRAQRELYEQAAELLGAPPPVVDADDILRDPAGVLWHLCQKINIPFTEEMLSWLPGRRETDGVWAAHWYGAVEESTGFKAPDPEDSPEGSPAGSGPAAVPERFAWLEEACRADYEAMAAQKLAPVT